jgi:hypothetical protein
MVSAGPIRRGRGLPKLTRKERNFESICMFAAARPLKYGDSPRPSPIGTSTHDLHGSGGGKRHAWGRVSHHVPPQAHLGLYVLHTYLGAIDAQTEKSRQASQVPRLSVSVSVTHMFPDAQYHPRGTDYIGTPCTLSQACFSDADQDPCPSRTRAAALPTYPP